MTVDSGEGVGKGGGNKEEESGREPVYLVSAADQVVKKCSSAVTQLHEQAVRVLHHKERNISLMAQ